MFLEVNNLQHTYMPGTPFEVHSLKGVSFSVKRGEFIGIMGSTGSGKSTLLQHLNGLLKPSGGEVRVDGKPLFGGSISLKKLRTRVGMVFQYPEHQFFAETVYQETAFGPSNQGLPHAQVVGRVKEALHQVSLDYEQIKDRSPFQLSGGQMRRLALAAVLSMEPEALILDEPTSGLDPRGREELLGHIEKLHREQGLTIIMVTHRPSELVPHVNRIYIMHRGKMTLCGIPAEVFSRSRELKEMGIELPAPVHLVEELRRRGYNLSPGKLTTEEVCKEIATKVTTPEEECE